METNNVETNNVENSKVSKKSDEELFWTLLEGFIIQANEKAEDVDLGIVASALMNASARFSAFYLAQSSESRKDLKEDKDTLVVDVSREFKKRFAENLEDYIENYKVLLNKTDDPV